MLQLKNVNKYYNKNKTNEIHVLNDINLDLGTVGLVAILGASGSGKTTLLNALCGLDKVDSGEIIVENNQLKKYLSHTWDDIRNEYFGYIFQNYNLFNDQTVFQNVAFSLEILGIKDQELIKTRTLEALEAVKMVKYKNRFAKNLSGGEQQRVAIARAIVKDAKFVIADEPTGNLDQKNTIRIMSILKEISKTRLVIMVTHEKSLANIYADRIIHLSDGKIIDDVFNTNSEGITLNDERTIYLGDMPHHQRLDNSLLDVAVYSDDALDKKLESVKLKLVVRGKTIYLLPEVSNYQFEVIDKDSLMEFNEGSKVDDIKEPFILPVELKDLPQKRKKFSLNLWRFYKKGIKDIMNVSKIKKFLLMGFVLASLLLTITIGLYRNVTSVNEDEFMNQNRDLVKVSYTYDENLEQVYNKQITTPNVYGFASSNQNPMMTMEAFLQTSWYNNQRDSLTSISGILVDYQKIVGYNGPIPSLGEIVIDQLVIDRLNQRSYDIIPMSEKMIIGQKVYVKDREFKIKGIAKGNNLAIYTTSFDALVVNLPYFEFPIYDLSEVTTTFSQLQKGEILVSSQNKLGLKVGDKKTLGDKDYTVKGFFTDSNKDNGYVFSLSDLSYYVFNRMLSTKNQYYLLSTTPLDTAKALDKSKMYIQSVYQEAYQTYQENRMGIFRVLFTLVGLMLIAPLLMLYFMMRSNMIAKIKDIGIYRALGLRKANLYKMHLGEILAITSLFSISGYLIAILIMTRSNQNQYITFFKMDIVTILGSIVIIFLINILVGLIPISRLLRRTPREILSKYDI